MISFHGIKPLALFSAEEPSPKEAKADAVSEKTTESVTNTSCTHKEHDAMDTTKSPSSPQMIPPKNVSEDEIWQEVSSWFLNHLRFSSVPKTVAFLQFLKY